MVCEETGDALALDPFDIDRTLEIAGEHDVKITKILSTHEHWDHAGRNEELRARTGAEVLACKWAAGVIEKIDIMLAEDDRVAVGSSVELRVIESPGHTMTHISLFGTEPSGPFLLCGDTLFGAGVGNCSYGGHAPTLYRSVEKLRSMVPGETRICPGHDYLTRNLEFALSIEPSNEHAKALLSEVTVGAAAVRFTTFTEEALVNPFMRLGSPELRSRVAPTFEGEPVSDEAVFLAVRARRDVW